MIVGIGIDIMEISRVERLLSKATSKFLNRFFTKREIAYCDASKHRSECFATIFAGKESLLKALGAGWQAGMKFVDIEILNDVNGRPTVMVSGEIKKTVDNLKIKNIFITVSCRLGNAMAQVLLEA